MRATDQDRFVIDPKLQKIDPPEPNGAFAPAKNRWRTRLKEVAKAIAFVACVVALYGYMTDPDSFVLGHAEIKVQRANKSHDVPADLPATKRMRSYRSPADGQRENPASPDAVLVHARALRAAPGAIVCPDYAAVQLMFSLFNHSWEEKMQDALTKGLSQTLRGPAAVEPDTSSFGCIIAADGSPMMKERGGIFPTVTVELADGSFFKGVTMVPMIGR